MSDNETGLPKYCYARGSKIWIRMKNEQGKWKNTRTDFTVDQKDQAAALVRVMLRAVESSKQDGDQGPMTLQRYGRRWCDDRDTRGVASAAEDRTRLEKYVFPHIGQVVLSDLKPRHARDMVRALRALRDEDGSATLAPRTVIAIYQLLHCVMEGAFVDELVAANTIKVKRGELPNKVDADPTWRSKATYAVTEVRRLVTESIIPAERRVQYALKALTGMRHGEVAALAWDQVDWTAQPLARINVVRAHCSRTREIKRTKTEATHAVPMHPSLARILIEWRDVHWVRVYGRAPTAHDLVVPTRTFRPVAAKDAGEAMKRDLALLGLRVDAGEHRDRGGHDLRSWYQTAMIEAGADSLLIRRTTHAPPKDVNSGYERFSWQALCREVSKLEFELAAPAGDDGPTMPACPHCAGTGRALPAALPLVTTSLRAEKNAGARWTSVATPTGFERLESDDPERSRAIISSGSTGSSASQEADGVTSSVHGVARREKDQNAVRYARRKTQLARIATEISIAIDRMDQSRAKDLLRRLRELEDASTVAPRRRVIESLSESPAR